MSQKFITKKEVIPILMFLAVGLITLAVYPCLPAKIPSHWNIAGNIDGYMSKNLAVIFFPAIILGIYLLMVGLPFIDPLKKNIEKSADAYFWLRTILVSFFSALYLFMIYAGLTGGAGTAINLFIMPLIGLMVVAMGFLMPKFKKNYFVGIRTPWTLESEEVWDKTHQRAQKWFIGAGLLLIVSSPFRVLGIWPIIIMIFLLLWPVVDSYILYKRK
ncbi:SdpI family protein [Patescibacteria group bacterium]